MARDGDNMDNTEHIEKCVIKFARHLFGPTNRDKIFKKWFQFLPSGCKGVIDGMEAVVRTILYGNIDIIINPNYIRVFVETETLHIPRNIISGTASRCILEMESERNRSLYFGQTVNFIHTMSGSFEMKKFRFNELFAKNINRDYLFKIIIFKGLMVALTTSNGLYYLDMLQVMNASLQNAAFSNQRPNDNTEGTAACPKVDHVESGLIGMLEIIRKPELFTFLCTIHGKMQSGSKAQDFSNYFPKKRRKTDHKVPESTSKNEEEEEGTTDDIKPSERVVEIT